MTKLTRFQKTAVIVAIWATVTLIMELNFALKGESRLALIMAPLVLAAMSFVATAAIYGLWAKLRR